METPLEAARRDGFLTIRDNDADDDTLVARWISECLTEDVPPVLIARSLRGRGRAFVYGYFRSPLAPSYEDQVKARRMRRQNDVPLPSGIAEVWATREVSSKAATELVHLIRGFNMKENDVAIVLQT